LQPLKYSDPTIKALKKSPGFWVDLTPKNRVANHRIVHGAVMAKRVWKLQDFVAHSGASLARAGLGGVSRAGLGGFLLFGTAIAA
jgi:hypothetical protein